MTRTKQRLIDAGLRPQEAQAWTDLRQTHLGDPWGRDA